jgi:hypothetical protein
MKDGKYLHVQGVYAFRIVFKHGSQQFNVNSSITTIQVAYSCNKESLCRVARPHILATHLFLFDSTVSNNSKKRNNWFTVCRKVETPPYLPANTGRGAGVVQIQYARPSPSNPFGW